MIRGCLLGYRVSLMVLGRGHVWHGLHEAFGMHGRHRDPALKGKYRDRKP
jgi:hypothetical protein